MCIDNSDIEMNFVGHIVYICPSSHHLHPRSARVQMMLLGHSINYMPSKSHLIVLLISPQRRWSEMKKKGGGGK